jgi:hypothetical protein
MQGIFANTDESTKEQGMAQDNPGQIQEDDITAVIGRFHAWNTAKVPVELPRTPNGVSKLQPITYEEALAAHRGYRTPPPEPVKSVFATESNLKSAVNSGKGLKTMMAAGLPPGPASRAEGTSKPISALNARSHTREKKVSVAVSECVVPTKASGVEQIKKVRTRSRGQLTEPVSAAIGKSKADGVRSSQVVPTSKSVIAKGRKKVLAADVPAPTQTFRNAFEKRMAADLSEEGNAQQYVTRGKSAEISQAWTIETVALATGNPGHGGPQGKTIAMKLRMSPGEHAQIKAGADEAGVTLAAYMRQCTLDVRVLRELLTRTIHDLKSAPNQSIAKVALRTSRESTAPPAASEPLSLMSAFKKIWTRKRLVMSA